MKGGEYNKRRIPPKGDIQSAVAWPVSGVYNQQSGGKRERVWSRPKSQNPTTPLPPQKEFLPLEYHPTYGRLRVLRVHSTFSTSHYSSDFTIRDTLSAYTINHRPPQTSVAAKASVACVGGRSKKHADVDVDVRTQSLQRSPATPPHITAARQVRHSSVS